MPAPRPTPGAPQADIDIPDSNARRGENRPRGAISVQTLIIASLASAAASFAVARIWGPGTLLGAAAAPVIVALVSESLRRPMRTVSASAKKVPTRRARAGGRGAADLHDRPMEASLTAQGRIGAWRPDWRLALATGAAAFAIVVGVYTVPDLLAGNSITGNGQPTTFFGGATTSQRAKPTSTVSTVTQKTVTKTAPAAVTKTSPAVRTTTTTTTAGTSAASPTTPTTTASGSATPTTPSTATTTPTTAAP